MSKTIKIPHRCYTNTIDIRNINDMLELKAKEGKLIPISQSKDLIEIAEPAFNAIWLIKLNEKGFIKEIDVF